MGGGVFASGGVKKQFMTPLMEFSGSAHVMYLFHQILGCSTFTSLRFRVQGQKIHGHNSISPDETGAEN